MSMFLVGVRRVETVGSAEAQLIFCGGHAEQRGRRRLGNVSPERDFGSRAGLEY